MKINPKYLELEKKYADLDCQYKKAFTHWIDNPTPKNEKAKDDLEVSMKKVYSILVDTPAWINA